ncbi:MAG: O-acetyl-ADP-ribose deacetylase [Methylomonas sp.]|nr:O-acetyl-ADP-ribose deacetylase [Methylomonas sp.]
MAKALISVVQGDITRLNVDGIVNAANQSLLGGGGVDGAIHRAAGSQLLDECRTLGGCETGEAKITGGYRLPARYVIHTVGPVWRGGQGGEPDLLAACYRNCLKLAQDRGIQTIAFPCISTGIYGFPMQQAARIAVATVDAFLRQQDSNIRVIFCCFSQGDAELYRQLLRD